MADWVGKGVGCGSELTIMEFGKILVRGLVLDGFRVERKYALLVSGDFCYFLVI
jgi:hypothetical protein